MQRFNTGKVKPGSFFPLFFMLTMAMSYVAAGQGKQYNVLFIGNSYTYTNDIPGMVSALASSTDDELTSSSSAPGGYWLEDHCSLSTTLNLIAQGGWDYVVIQEQSLGPAFAQRYVEAWTYPFAQRLDELVKESNPCAKTVFYNTWGRKNGINTVCQYHDYETGCDTYEGMDDFLQLSYTTMAQDNEALLCPAGKVWRNLRTNHPDIELYNSDESHPSVEGSYASACAFYTIFFKKDPALCTYTAGLPQETATAIRNAAKAIVYDHLDDYYQYYPNINTDFSYSVSSQEVTFANTSENAETYAWDFGDGSAISTEENPVHIYTGTGPYEVKLISTTCEDTDTLKKTVSLLTTGLEIAEGKNIKLYPNPANHELHIEYKAAMDEIAVFDLSGQALKRVAAGSSAPNVLDISELKAGTYILCLRSEGKNVYTRFVKQ